MSDAEGNRHQLLQIANSTHQPWRPWSCRSRVAAGGLEVDWCDHVPDVIAWAMSLSSSPGAAVFSDRDERKLL